jgi:hypothetical protein
VTYDQMMEAIGGGQKEDWLAVGLVRVYKGDLNLRIEEADNHGMSGLPFSEPWVDDLPGAAPPKRIVYWVHYGATRVLEIHAVLVDGRTVVPLPDAQDRLSMDRWNYSFGKIVEEYDVIELGGTYSLDAILARAGIRVR